MLPAAARLVPLLCLLQTVSAPEHLRGDSRVAAVEATEGSDVLLPCHRAASLVGGAFDWKKGQQEVFLFVRGHHYNNGRAGQDAQFKGRVSHSEDELRRGNASILLRGVRAADAGDYTCVFPGSDGKHERQLVRLDVVKVPENQTEVNVTNVHFGMLDDVGDVVPLRCDVLAVSPTVEIQDAAGNILEADRRGNGSSVSVTANASERASGRFFCVVRQEGMPAFRVELDVPGKRNGDRNSAAVIPFLMFAVGACVGAALTWGGSRARKRFSSAGGSALTCPPSHHRMEDDASRPLTVPGSLQDERKVPID